MRSYFQNNRTRQYRAEHSSFSNLSVVPVLLVMLSAPLHAVAATSDDSFEQYMFAVCNQTTVPPIVPTAENVALCDAVSFGGPAGGGPAYQSSSNLGTTNASSGTALRKKKGVRERLEELKEEPEKAASADGGGWGLLVAPQYGKSTRPETELENGFQSDLRGLLLGLDYRFSDSFVLGAAVGHTKDDANFINNAGFLKTTNNTLTLYGTWVPTESGYVDGYLGAGKLSFDSQRQVVFGTTISGTASGNSTGSQIMAGASAGYKTEFGRVNFEPFINFDYIKTNIDGYDESGTTLLELRYSDRSTVSTTSSLGGQASMAFGYHWGTLLPSARLAAVREFKNDSRRIDSTVIVAPTQPFLVDTDAPDRNYYLSGLGVVAALNDGTQLFLNYEKRNQDKLLDSWAVSLGVLVEY